MPRVYREDQAGPHRTAFDKNKKRIYATQTICGICGRPVDKTLRYPDPMAPCVDLSSLSHGAGTRQTSRICSLHTGSATGKRRTNWRMKRKTEVLHSS